MGARGPKPKTEDGSRTRKRRPAASEKKKKAPEKPPVIKATIQRPSSTTPPDYLIPEAAAVWLERVPGWLAEGVIRESDLDLVAGYCQELGRAIKYERFVYENSEYKRRGSQMTLRPEVKFARDCWDRASKLAQRLGLKNRRTAAAPDKPGSTPNDEPGTSAADKRASIFRRQT